MLENSKLYSFQSQRNYYFDYSQSFIIRTEKKYETAGKFQITPISNFLIAHSTKLLLNLASLDTDTKSYSKFHARVFRSLAFAGNVSDFVPSDVLQELLITLCRALRTSRAPLFDRRAAAAGKKKKKRKGKRRGEEEDERERRTNPSAESRRGTVEERPTWTWNQNLNELRGHAPVLPVYRTPLHSWNVAEAFNGVFIVARSWRDLIWITNDEEQTIVVAFICQNPRTIFGSFARKLAAHEDNGNAILGMEKWSRFDECRLRVSDFVFFSFHEFDKSRDFLYFFWRSLNYAYFVKRNNSSLHFTINSQFEKRIDTKYSLPWINQAS